jgi:NAD(P)-dependent dehydrogenase (short-subunit alcohol dehydrogenase family)
MPGAPDRPESSIHIVAQCFRRGGEGDIGCGVDRHHTRLFELDGSVAVVTGGTGTLGSALARGLAAAGVRVGILGRGRERGERLAAEIESTGGHAAFVAADVLKRADLEAARDELLGRWGRLDILINGAGGNLDGATTTPDRSFFDLSEDALKRVVDLNLMGTILATQVCGTAFARDGRGCIVNVSSMAARAGLTRVAAYGAAKAGVEALTRALASEMALMHGSGIRVNAVAPGFFLADQNRRLLMNPDGTPTKRGQDILAHTPSGRFGEPEDLIGTVVWLCSPAAAFVTGVVVPVDGGFSAFSGI